MGSTVGLEPQDLAFSYRVGAASLNASLKGRRWLVVGWSADDSVPRAKQFFRHTDSEVFLVHPGRTGPVRIPLSDVTDGSAEGRFIRLEAGIGDNTLVVCANPDRPEPEAFDNLSVEFAVERLPEVESRLLDAVVGSSGPLVAYGSQEVRRALHDLANDLEERRR